MLTVTAMCRQSSQVQHTSGAVEGPMGVWKHGRFALLAIESYGLADIASYFGHAL